MKRPSHLLSSLVAVLALSAVSSPVGAAQHVQAQDALDAAWREALAATPTPVSLERDRADAGTITAEEAPDFIAQLRRDTAWDQSVAAVRTDVGRLTQGCATPGLDGCTARQGGWLTAPSGEVLYWQIQKGSTDEGGTMEAVVLFQPGADGALRPIGWTRGGFYQPPVLIQGGENASLHVAVSGVFPGTGARNADLLYRWTPGAERPLAEIDAVSWRDGLAARLPAGLEVWKGVEMDYASLRASSPLWQASDANCCASGGSVWLSFSISEDRLVLDDVSVRDPLIDLSRTLPTEVFDYAGRRAGCAHFGGEPADDPDRRAQIEATMSELRCDTLEADAAALKARYADAPSMLAAIARIEVQYATDGG
jgi:hypothetical protein